MFTRLCIDLDRAGNVAGTSYEVHADGTTTTIVVLPPPGPFDTPAEALESALSRFRQDVGEQASIF